MTPSMSLQHHQHIFFCCLFDGSTCAFVAVVFSGFSSVLVVFIWAHVKAMITLARLRNNKHLHRFRGKELNTYLKL